MRDIYRYVPEIVLVPMVNIVAAVLAIQFVLGVTLFHMLRVLLCSYINTIRSMCAVPNMVVLCYYFRHHHHHILYAGYLYLFSLLHRACCRVTQLLHQPLYIYKIYKIYTLKH